MATISKSRGRIEPWFFYLFGLLTGVLSVGDNVPTVLAIVALSAGVALGGTLDAVQSAATIIGAVIFGVLADRLRLLKPALVKLFLSVAFVMGLYALVHNPTVMIVVTVLFGFLVAAPSPIANTFITRFFPAEEWASKFGTLNAASFMGIVFLFGLAIIGLFVLPLLFGTEMAVRIILSVGGFLALLGALALWLMIREVATTRSTHPRAPYPHHLQSAKATAEAIHIAGPSAVNDKLMVHYIATVCSFFGIGMAGSALPYYLTKSLGAPVQTVPLILLGFFLASAISSAKLSSKITAVTPLRALAMAIAFRAFCLLLIPVLGHFLPSLSAILVTGVLIAFTGGAGGVMSVASAIRVATLAHPRRHGAAMGLLSASTNLGALLGALAGGLIGSFYPLAAIFFLGALIAALGCMLLLKL